MTNQKIVEYIFPPKLLEQLDFIRHSIPRSKYLQMLVEQNVKFMETFRLTLDTVVHDTLRIAKAVRVDLNEADCNHSIQEIVKEALSPVASTSPIPQDSRSIDDHPTEKIDY